MSRVFIDSNIFIRHLTQDSSELSPKATSFFEDIAKGEIVGYLTSLVMHEVTYVLRSVYKVEREEIASKLVELIRVQNLEILDISKETLIAALIEYKRSSVDLADILYKHWALKRSLKIFSFDKDMTKIKAPLYKLKK